MARAAAPKLASRSYGRGRLVVLVHGFGADGTTWGQLPALLAAAGCRVVAPDLLGCGRSPKPKLVTLPLQAASLAALLRRLGRPATLVAHSYGGAVALLAAAQLSRRVLGQLVLVCPAALPHRLPRSVRLASSPMGIALGERVPAAAQAAALLAASIALGSRPAAADLVAYAAALARQRRSLAAIAESLWSTPEATLAAAYGRVRTPTLLLWGDRDRVVPASHAPRLRRLLRGASSATIRGCGHVPHLEQPAALARAILDAGR